MSENINITEKKHSTVGTAENTAQRPIFNPLVDIWESNTGLTLVADMPGVTTENLSVDLNENTLTISAKVFPPFKVEKYILKEYEVGDFYRQFILSEHIDQNKITATLKNGVLTLELPKVEASEPKKIEVTVE